jgi:Holliday junction resolvasome RuvABC DNA-binding subunit
VVQDAAQALVSIGFSDKEAQKSVAKAVEKVGTDDLEVLVLTALRG